MNALRLMHLRQLRRQPLRVVLAVLAIAAGVTLTVAVLVARSSLEQSFARYSTALSVATCSAPRRNLTVLAAMIGSRYRDEK